MIEKIFDRDSGHFLGCGFDPADQLRGLRWRQFRGFVVDEAGKRIAGRQQFDAAAKQHFEFARNSGHRNHGCPTGVQPESESGR